MNGGAGVMEEVQCVGSDGRGHYRDEQRDREGGGGVREE